MEWGQVAEFGEMLLGGLVCPFTGDANGHKAARVQFIFALARPTIATRASRRLAGHVVATFKSLQAVLQMNKRETLLTEISKGRSKKRISGLSPKRGVSASQLICEISQSFFSYWKHPEML